MRRAASGRAGGGYKNRERQSNTENSLRAVHPGRDAVTPPSVVLRLTGSRQGNRGPPLPPPLIGCLCWLRHTGLAGPGGPAPGAGRWRRLLSCRSAAESQPLAWSPPPLRALGECWMGGVATSGGRTGRILRDETETRIFILMWENTRQDLRSYLCSVGRCLLHSPYFRWNLFTPPVKHKHVRMRNTTGVRSLL